MTFSANVRFGAPGASYTYQWEFGEGPVQGKSVTHTPDIPGTLFAQVEVTNADPSCTTRCGGTERVTVEVGEVPEQPEDTTAGGANGTPGGAGSSGGTGGGGTGGSGTGSGRQRAGDGPGQRRPSPRRTRAEAQAAAPAAQAVRHDDLRRAHQRHRHDRREAARRRARRRRRGRPGGARRRYRPARCRSASSGLLALAVMWVGALRERRGVRLRVA